MDAEEIIEWKKYSTYSLDVDPDQDDRAREIKLCCNFSRPHMRAFHCSWLGVFFSYFIFNAGAPILVMRASAIGITKTEIWLSTLWNTIGTIFMRVVSGLLCDKFGARLPMALVLLFVSLMFAFYRLVNGPMSLNILRFFMGFGGSTLVMCQYWTSTMFTKERVGFANGLVGGFGLASKEISHLIMNILLSQLFVNIDIMPDTALQIMYAIFAFAACSFGLAILFISDDSPKGNYNERKKMGSMSEVSLASSFCAGVLNLNSWILFVQYACSFGVEITMINAGYMYFNEQFGQTHQVVQKMVSIVGCMRLVFNAVGGFCSDYSNSKYGMRGRLIFQTICLTGEGCGIMLFTFVNTKTTGLAFLSMIVTAIFCQASQGSTFGIAPYVSPRSTGSVLGIVSAGGNVAAICFGLAFRNLAHKEAMSIMGGCALVSAWLSALVFIKDHAGMFFRQDSDQIKSKWNRNKVDLDAIAAL